jgi:hypothetical protein
MASARQTYVHEAALQLEVGTDPAAPGGAVTTALCGRWEHEGPCRWPHNNEIAVTDVLAIFHTLFAAPAADEHEVRTLIEGALRNDAGWSVVRTRSRPVSEPERALAGRLAATPST